MTDTKRARVVKCEGLARQITWCNNDYTRNSTLQDLERWLLLCLEHLQVKRSDIPNPYPIPLTEEEKKKLTGPTPPMPRHRLSCEFSWLWQEHFIPEIRRGLLTDDNDLVGKVLNVVQVQIMALQNQKIDDPMYTYLVPDLEKWCQIWSLIHGYPPITLDIINRTIQKEWDLNPHSISAKLHLRNALSGCASSHLQAILAKLPPRSLLLEENAKAWGHLATRFDRSLAIENINVDAKIAAAVAATATGASNTSSVATASTTATATDAVPAKIDTQGAKTQTTQKQVVPIRQGFGRPVTNDKPKPTDFQELKEIYDLNSQTIENQRKAAADSASSVYDQKRDALRAEMSLKVGPILLWFWKNDVPDRPLSRLHTTLYELARLPYDKRTELGFQKSIATQTTSDFKLDLGPSGGAAWIYAFSLLTEPDAVLLSDLLTFERES